MKIKFESEEAAFALHGILLTMCRPCPGGTEYEICTHCPHLISTLNEKGYIKQSELEKAKDEYYKIGHNGKKMTDIRILSYVLLLEQEIKRLKSE